MRARSRMGGKVKSYCMYGKDYLYSTSALAPGRDGTSTSTSTGTGTVSGNSPSIPKTASQRTTCARLHYDEYAYCTARPGQPRHELGWSGVRGISRRGGGGGQAPGRPEGATRGHPEDDPPRIPQPGMPHSIR